MKNKLTMAGLAVFAGLFMSTSASATTIAANSMFNLGGTVQASSSGLSFYYAAPGDQMATILLPASGDFSGLSGTQGIKNLLAPAVVPGTSFPTFVDWITLSNGIDVDLTSIPIPNLPLCSGGATTGCLVNASSPVVLKITNGVVNAGLLVNGEAYYTASGPSTEVPIIGTFISTNTQYTSIPAFEAAFFGSGNGGAQAISYQANFITSAVTTTPEPAAIFLASFGLVGLGLLRRRKASR